MTEQLRLYLELIKNQLIGDWWYDDVSNTLIEYTYEFDSSDWDYLLHAIGGLPPVSQEKVLYTIDEANPLYGLRIGMALLNSEDDMVFDCALSAVDQCFNRIKVEDLDIAILNDLESRIPDRPIAKKIYQNLRRKIERTADGA